ncbi:hypothetical protein BV20DRAFT_1114929 [Pilatotrama ljubarskyi]|nr:hypothetical protein BV20DRAFT_1114929 [Pilatotrama ljubarskyi]
MESSREDVLRGVGLQGPYYGLPPVPDTAFSPTAPAKELHSRLLERKRRLELETLSTNALINACASINRLPNEILVEIMIWVQIAYAGPDHLRWLTLLHVCRHWFVVASTTSKMWRILYGGDCLNYFRTALVRSRDSPIAVMVGNPRAVPEVIELLFPHAHRVQHLWIFAVGRPDSPRLVALLQNRMPVLETLSVSIGKTIFDPSEEVVDLPLERFPRLRHLSVSGLYTPPSTLFRQLKVLHLVGWLGLIPELKLDSFTQILRECVDVEELTIRDVLCRDHDTPQQYTNFARIAVSKLRCLHMATEAGIIKHFLSVLAIPPATHVSIEIPVNSDVPQEELTLGLQAVMPDDRSGLSLLPHLKTATVRAFDDQRVLVAAQSASGLDGGTQPGGLTVTLANPDGLPDVESIVLDDFVGICRDSPLEELRIKMEADKVGHVNWRVVFAHFPKLKSLSVFGSGMEDHAYKVFRGLNPEVAPDGTRDQDRLVCPELRSVRIEGFDGRHVLVLPHAARCLKARMEALGRPVALEELSFSIVFRARSEEQFEERQREYSESLRPLVGRFSYERA